MIKANSKKNTQRVYLNLIQQEVYFRNPEILTSNPGKKASKTYYELKEVIQADGSRIEKLVEVDYPISAESVKSYVESTDYKRNLEQAFNAPPKGRNLGDVVDMQKLLSMDKQQILEVYNQLGERIKAVSAKNSTNVVDNSNKEVNNNEK